MSVSVLSCNFGIKLVLSQNWGARVDPKFWRDRQLPSGSASQKEGQPDEWID